MQKIPMMPDLFRQEDKFLNALADAYRLQEAIINTTELSIISTNNQGIINSFNKASEQLLGYSFDEVLDKQSIDILYLRDELESRARELTIKTGKKVSPGFVSIMSSLTDPQPDRREWTYVRQDGSTVAVSVSATALKDERGNLTGFAVIATDISEQKEAEEKIKRSESNLTALISSLDEIVFEIDDAGRFREVWVKDDSYLFLPRQDIYGKTLEEIFGKEFVAPFADRLNKTLRDGGSFNYEYSALGKNDHRWFLAKFNSIRKEGEHPRRVSIAIQDITSRKNTELALRKSEEKFRLLAENIPGTIYLCKHDEKYTMLYLNHHVKELTGYEAEMFLQGKISFVDLLHPEDKQYVVSSIDEAIAGNRPFNIVYRIYDRAGEIRWLEETGIGVLKEDGKETIEGYITDITYRKYAEEELRRMAEENLRVFNNSLNMNAIIGFDGTWKKMNRAWETLLRWPVDTLIDQPYDALLHIDDVAKTEEAMGQMRSGMTITNFENRYRHEDGSYRWLWWNFSPDNRRKLIYATANDITERKKAEEELLLSKKNLEVAAFELQEQNRQLDEFAHIISHNLRAPVGNIKALINFISEASTMDEYRLIFDKIKNVSEKLGETMNELMETMKIKKNQEIERVEIRFKDMLDKVIQFLEGELIGCGATVTFDFNEAPKIVYARPYMESILQNLMSNAIKYRSPDRPPVIHLSTQFRNDRVELRVKDNGLGIDLNQFRDKLFGLHKTFHDNKEARGVGLFLTKTQIETMGGQIAVESEVNEGTTFIITF